MFALSAEPPGEVCLRPPSTRQPPWIRSYLAAHNEQTTRPRAYRTGEFGPRMGEPGPNRLAFPGDPRYSLCSTGATASVLRVFQRNVPLLCPMQTYRPRSLDPTKILTRRELAAVLADLKRKAPRSPSTRLNLVVFRLACCCGLRASEIARLQVADVRVEPSRPHLRIRNGAAKGGRPRTVPLWWDAGTLADVTGWKQQRLGEGASATEGFVASQRPGRGAGMPLSRHTLRKRFRTACKLLGRDRLAWRTIHHGRHTFISHALAGGRTLAEVRDAAGHTHVSITSVYLYVAVDDTTLGDLFRFAPNSP
jgi:integrase